MERPKRKTAGKRHAKKRQKVAVEQPVVEAAVAPPEQPAKLTLAVLAGMGHKALQAKAFELHILAAVPKKGNRYLKADLFDAITKHIQKGKSAMEVLPVVSRLKIHKNT